MAKALVGILGGVGPAATARLSTLIVERTEARCDQEHVRTLVFNDATLPDRSAFILGRSDASPLEGLVRDARLLERCGCTALALPCNTAHAFWDVIQAAVAIPLVNMVDRTAQICQRVNAACVGVLATEGTVAAGVYERALALRAPSACTNASRTITAADFFDAAPAVQYLMDEPLPNPSAVPLYHLTQFAAEEVKVVMSGEGADELFGGYAYYQECLDFEPYMKVPRPVRALAGNIAAALPPFHGQRFLMRGRDALPVRYIRNNYVFNYDDCSRSLAQPVRCARPETPHRARARRSCRPRRDHADAVRRHGRVDAVRHPAEGRQDVDGSLA